MLYRWISLYATLHNTIYSYVVYTKQVDFQIIWFYFQTVQINVLSRVQITDSNKPFILIVENDSNALRWKWLWSVIKVFHGDEYFFKGNRKLFFSAKIQESDTYYLVWRIVKDCSNYTKIPKRFLPISSGLWIKLLNPMETIRNFQITTSILKVAVVLPPLFFGISPLFWNVKEYC